MKVQRTISLDERTAELAGRIPNLSAWVRARLLAFDEGTIDETAERLQAVSTLRLLAITQARMYDLHSGATAQVAFEAANAISALAKELRNRDA